MNILFSVPSDLTAGGLLLEATFVALSEALVLVLVRGTSSSDMIFLFLFNYAEVKKYAMCSNNPFHVKPYVVTIILCPSSCLTLVVVGGALRCVCKKVLLYCQLAVSCSSKF